MIYYRRYLGDYARDAGHLTALEHGIYNLLLDWYYINEQPIPDDRAHRIARSGRPEVEIILKEFFVFDAESSVWRQKRVDDELDKYAKFCEQNQIKGKLGGRPKKTQPKPNGNPEETQRVSENNPTGTQPKPGDNPTKTNIQYSVVNTRRNISKSNADSYSDEFESFWASWPQGLGEKGSKAEAASVWRKIKPDADLVWAMDVAVTRQAELKREARRRGEFAPDFKHVCRWLKGREWENEVATVPQEVML